MRFLNFGGGQRKFFARDFRNAYQFRPDVAPPRQKFQGYVNFIPNRDITRTITLGDKDSTEFRTRISSLVKTALLPEVQFKTEVKNKYNRKKIVQTGLEYGPVSVTVHDTIQNEWLTLFMRYYSHLYMNPRNKFYDDNRDPINFFRSNHEYMQESKLGQQSSKYVAYNSNDFGFNLSETPNFFERIDFILYHGDTGVQYSITNPVMTRMRFSEIDYSSSDTMDFQMDFEYENFTTSNKFNFPLTDTDLERFEQIDKPENLPGYVNGKKPIAVTSSSNMDVSGILGRAQDSGKEGRKRAQQVLVDQFKKEDPIGDPFMNAIVLNASRPTYVTAPGSGDDGGGESGFFGKIGDFLENNPFGRIVDRALSAKINGQDVGEAAKGALAGEISTAISTPKEGDIFGGRGVTAPDLINRWTGKTGTQPETGGGDT